MTRPPDNSNLCHVRNRPAPEGFIYNPLNHTKIQPDLLHTLLHVELDDGRLLAVGAHVLPRESDRLLLQALTAM